MAIQDSTTKEKEFDGEISKAESILCGLGAIGFLLHRANEDETDYSEKYLRDLFKGCPWIGGDDFPLSGQLSRSLKTGLGELILREAGEAWKCVDMASQIIMREKDTGKLIWLAEKPAQDTE